MKSIAFEEIEVNTVFAIKQDLTASQWCVKIDDSRYIHIGANGSYHPLSTDWFFTEDSEQ